MKTSNLSSRHKNQIGTSTSSQDQTPVIPPSLSVSKQGVLAAPSKPSASTASSNISTPSTLEQLAITSNVVPTDDQRTHADFARAALLQLEAAGLCFRQRVLADDKKTVLAIRVIFHPSLWSEDIIFLR